MTIPQWAIQQAQVQAQKFSNDINASEEGNRQRLTERWLGYLDGYADRANTSAKEMAKAAGLDGYENYLPPPTN